MSTIKALAAKLGVSPRTVRNHQKEGYALVYKGCGALDEEESVRCYIAYLSEKLRQSKARNGRDCDGNGGNGQEPESFDDWKTEKEKQAAIKLRLQNDRDQGDLVPADAMLELYNAPLSLVREKLMDLSNQLQKRMTLGPEQVALVDEAVRDSLEGLRGKTGDELRSVIEQIIRRYSKYYYTTGEDTDSELDEEQP